MVYTKELKDHVTTLEQSKELINLGVDYETEFVWYVELEHNSTSIRLRVKVGNFFDVEIHSAFLTDELIDICYQLESWMNVHGITIKNRDTLVNTI